MIDKATPRTRLIGAVVMTATVSACFGNSPDAVELSNIRESNIVPKSSPTSFVSTFEKMCLGPINSKSGFETTLRNASYVPTRPRNARGFRTYLVDDRRPAVVTQEQTTHRACAVLAVARTGQTQRVRNAVPRLFPNAKAASPSKVKGAEQVWIEPDAPERLIYTSRDKKIPSGASYRLAIIEMK